MNGAEGRFAPPQEPGRPRRCRAAIAAIAVPAASSAFLPARAAAEEVTITVDPSSLLGGIVDGIGSLILCGLFGLFIISLFVAMPSPRRDRDRDVLLSEREEGPAVGGSAEDAADAAGGISASDASAERATQPATPEGPGCGAGR